MKKMKIIPQSLSLRQFLATNICYYAFEKRKNEVLAALQWQAAGTDYTNPNACLHDNFLRNQGIAEQEANAFVEQMTAKPPMDRDFWDGFFHTLWEGFFRALEDKFFNESSLLSCMAHEPKETQAEPDPEPNSASQVWLAFLTNASGEDDTLYD